MKVKMNKPKATNVTVDYSQDFNQMWNVVYKLQAAIEPIMPSDRGSDRICPKSETDSCPSGHMLVPCSHGSDEYYCKQCSENTFQPDENWITDKCRFRRQCNKPFMRYADPGSSVKDATCACMVGYHFLNEDQRLCVQNIVCPKGKAPGIYGNCESCLRKSMYSDTEDKVKKCKPLTNCEKQSKCTIVKSNGEADNVCGPVVKDLNSCEDINISVTSSSASVTIAIIGSIIAVALLLVILLTVIFFWRRKRLRHKINQRALTEEEMEELQQKIIKECDRDPSLCKKVLSTSSSFIEERIERQIWTLPQELFRSSAKQGHFEQIVDKYKDTQAKYTINGYLHEWKVWKGENKEAVVELFRCLRYVKRDDIVNEICLCLRKDVDYNIDTVCHTEYNSTKLSMKDECTYIFFPCLYHSKDKLSPSSTAAVVVESDVGEAGTKLLAIATDDIDHDDGANSCTGGNQAPATFYHTHPSPSAPSLEDMNNVFPSVDNVKYSRQFSQPVQATS